MPNDISKCDTNIVKSEDIDSLRDDLFMMNKEIMKSNDSLDDLEIEINKVHENHKVYKFKMKKVQRKMRDFLQDC